MSETRDTLERFEQTERLTATQERFARRAALLVAVVAAGLAIATLAGNAAVTEAILDQAKASDAWNEFQANSLKRHINENDAALLRLLSRGTATEREALARADDLEKSVREKYRPNQDSLFEKATHLEEQRESAELRHHGFQLAEAAFQLAIVLGSASIIARSSPLLVGAGVLGIAGVLLAANALAGVARF